MARVFPLTVYLDEEVFISVEVLLPSGECDQPLSAIPGRESHVTVNCSLDEILFAK